jgi:diaminopimelate epimerase
MAATIEFMKSSGSGNDFVCIDNRDGRHDAMLAVNARVAHFARSLCRRGLGVGADGVIFAGTPEIAGVADLAARFFEADGSEAELCGNGTACFADWAIAEGFVADKEIGILTNAGVVLASRVGSPYVRVCLPVPMNMQRDIEIVLDGFLCLCDFALVGVPHAVIYVDDVERADVAHIGPLLRHHKRFAPGGVNANFVQVLGPGKIALRTYEYGVEGETMACGTGSAAAAMLATLRYGWQNLTCGRRPVDVLAHSGDTLRVYFTCDPDGAIVDPCLETVVRSAYRGVLAHDLAAEAMNVQH